MDSLESVALETFKKRLSNYRIVFDKKYLHIVIVPDGVAWLSQ